jgi:hypothetical protein
MQDRRTDDARQEDRQYEGKEEVDEEKDTASLVVLLSTLEGPARGLNS